MEFQIKPYSDIYWDQFIELIDIYWKKGHPITNKDLFTWQYEGYGPKKGVQNIKLLFVNEKLEGVRGVIPGIYQLPKVKNQIGKPECVNGGSFAMWLINPEYRGKGLGSELLKEVSKEHQVLISVGSNVKTSAPIYLKNGFTCLEALNRYVIPLESQGYINLLSNQVASKLILEWIDKNYNVSPSEKPISPNPHELGLLWEKSTNNISFFSLLRNKEFWEWRYIKSPGFKYIFFGDYESRGIVVARIEKVYSPLNPDTHGLKVFRIIEIIPYQSNVWAGESNKQTEDFLKGVLNWSRENGCCAADYQCSNSRLERLLMNVGFQKQNSNYGPEICSLAGLFQPLVYKPAPINALWRITNSKGQILKINKEETYIVKSDNDMDRPNIWPVFT